MRFRGRAPGSRADARARGAKRRRSRRGSSADAIVGKRRRASARVPPRDFRRQMLTGKRHRSGASRAFGASRVDRNAGAGGGRDAHLDGAERRDGGEGEGGHRVCVWWRERCVRAMTRSRVAGADNLRFGKVPRQGGRSPREGPVGTLLRHHDELQSRCAAHPAALYWASTAPGARDDHLRRRSPDRGRCPRCRVWRRGYRASRRRARPLASRRVARRRRAPGDSRSLGFHSSRGDPDLRPDPPSRAFARPPPDRASPPWSFERVGASSSLAPPRPCP